MIYLDNAATTWPKPTEVSEAVRRALTVPFGNPGRGSHKASENAMKTVYSLRETAADFFGAEPENVVLTSSATDGLNKAIKGAAGSYGKFLISDIEHNSVRRPVLSLADSGLCSVEVYHAFGKTDDEITDELKRRIIPGKTAVVSIHASNICNARLPIAKIGDVCRKNDCLFIVDASQSAGHIKTDVEKMKIDVLCLPGHKGLYGPMGTGLLIFGGSAASKIGEFSTIVEGGSGVDSLSDRMPDYLPERFEAGTINAHGSAGLLAGIKWLRETGIDRVSTHEKKLYDLFTDILSSYDRITLYGDQTPGPVVLFNIEGFPSGTVGRMLNERNICVRTGFHCSPLAHRSLGTGKDGAVRVSFGFFNTEAEVEKAAHEIIKLTG